MDSWLDFLTCGLQIFPQYFSLEVVCIHLLSENKKTAHTHTHTPPLVFFIFSISSFVLWFEERYYHLVQ